MIRSFLDSLSLAFSTLTCFPLPMKRVTPRRMKDSVVLYPLVGASLGGCLYPVLELPLPRDLQALGVLGLWVVLTLAFHLDGLGDCLDGWLGGKDPGERRRIMKDPALGAYGAVGIGLDLLAKYVLLSHLLVKGDAGQWLIVIPALGRFSVVFSCWTASAPSGHKGLGSGVLGLSPTRFLISFILTWPLLLLVGRNGLWAWGIALGVSGALTLLSKERIGGTTGDGLGATIEIAEVGLLLFACLGSP